MYYYDYHHFHYKSKIAYYCCYHYSYYCLYHCTAYKVARYYPSPLLTRRFTWSNSGYTDKTSLRLIRRIGGVEFKLTSNSYIEFTYRNHISSSNIELTRSLTSNSQIELTGCRIWDAGSGPPGSRDVGSGSAPTLK